MQEAANVDKNFALHSHCPYSIDFVNNYYSMETGWETLPADGMGNLFACKDLVSVCAHEKANEKKLAAIAFAVPTQTPYVSDFPTYLLSFIVVARTHRNKGLGRRVMSEMIRICADERG